MTLIKDSHNTLFHELFSELAGDIGHSITVYSKTTGVECSYCYFDVKTGRSSGKQKITWSIHPNYDNVGLVCPECFTPDNLVLTSKGYKKISEIQIGDLVLTHTGNFKPVINVFTRKYEGDILRIKSSSSPEYIECTPNHKFQYLKNYYCHRKGRESRSCLVCKQKDCSKEVKIESYWEEAKNIDKNDYIQYANFNITNNKIILKDKYEFKVKSSKTKEILPLLSDRLLNYIIGLYIAEGSFKDREINFAFHINEKEYVKRVSDFFTQYGFTVHIKQHSINGVVVIISSTKLSKFFNHYCGYLSKNKHIPYELVNNKAVFEIFDGIFHGDGHGYTSSSELSITTVSKELILQLALFCRANKWLFNIYKGKGGYRHNCNHQDYYVISFIPKYSKSSSLFYLEDKCFVKIKDIQKIQYSGLVYNLEVEEDHTYTVNNIIVSNCHGKGKISTETVTTVNNVIIEDMSGVQMKQGKFAWFNDGTRKLMGKLIDILTIPSDSTSSTIFDNATRIVIYGEEHRLVRMNRLGLKDLYVYEAIVEKIASV